GVEVVARLTALREKLGKRARFVANELALLGGTADANGAGHPDPGRDERVPERLAGEQARVVHALAVADGLAAFGHAAGNFGVKALAAWNEPDSRRWPRAARRRLDLTLDVDETLRLERHLGGGSPLA